MMSILVCRDWHPQPRVTLPPVFFKAVSVALLLAVPAMASPAPVFVPIVKPSAVIVLGCPSGRCPAPRTGPKINTRAKHRNNDPFGRSHLTPVRFWMSARISARVLIGCRPHRL